MQIHEQAVQHGRIALAGEDRLEFAVVAHCSLETFMAQQAANGLEPVRMLVEEQLCCEMAELVRRHHQSRFPRDECRYLLTKATTWATRTIFPGKKPGCGRPDKNGPVVPNVVVQVLRQMRRQYCFDCDVILRFVRWDAEEGAIADDLQVLIEPQSSKIAGAYRDIEQDSDSDGEFNPHAVAASDLVASSNLRHYPFWQSQQRYEFLAVFELAEAAAVFLAEPFARRLERPGQLAQLIDGRFGRAEVMPGDCLEKSGGLIDAVCRLVGGAMIQKPQQVFGVFQVDEYVKARNLCSEDATAYKGCCSR